MSDNRPFKSSPDDVADYYSERLIDGEMNYAQAMKCVNDMGKVAGRPSVEVVKDKIDKAIEGKTIKRIRHWREPRLIKFTRKEAKHQARYYVTVTKRLIKENQLLSRSYYRKNGKLIVRKTPKPRSLAETLKREEG